MPESTLAYLPGGEKGISVWFWASLNPDNLFSVGFQKEDGRVGYCEPAPWNLFSPSCCC
jgi:hypothetical protein